jgi:hypothetical protein
MDIHLRRVAFGVGESDFVAFLHQGANRNRQFVEIVAGAGINLAIFQGQAATARYQYQDFSFCCHFVFLSEIESVPPKYNGQAISHCCSFWLRKPEHQPRLIRYPMRVQLRHFIEQLRVGRSGFLQPIEVLQITVQGKVSRSTTMNLLDERISCPDLTGITEWCRQIVKGSRPPDFVLLAEVAQGQAY